MLDIGFIEFRVVRSGSPPRRMRLNTARCTLGSGDGCTVRLADSSLRPMHAVVLRDANRVLLRAYTVPIEVNGHLTGESFLHLGDTFVLGSYEFELVESPESITEDAVELYSAKPNISRNVAKSSRDNTSGLLVDAESMQELPLRSVRTPMDITENDGLAAAAGGGSNDGEVVVPRRSRLSFSGGGMYVSDAVQTIGFSAPPRPPAEASNQNATHRGESDRLRRELEAWQHRERQWKQQEQDLRAEFFEAIERFNESQALANRASEAVAEMQRRLSQLTEEIRCLSSDSLESQRQSSEREERLRQAIDAASTARDQAVRQRDDALTDRDSSLRAREQAAVENAEWKLRSKRAEEASESAAQELATAQDKLQNAQARMSALTVELGSATENLRLAREEIAVAFARIDELSTEATVLRERLKNRDQVDQQSSTNSQVALESLRDEVKRLESECAKARQDASSASNDRRLVVSLESRLASIEGQRNADRLSWEQEATSLQETIQELSLELASVTGRLTQSQADRQTLKDELDYAERRLEGTRKDLSSRPTVEQWDAIRTQLLESETKLGESERQLQSLQLEFDALVRRQGSTEATPHSLPVDRVSLGEEFIGEQSSDQENAWPTYQSRDSYTSHRLDSLESDEESESGNPLDQAAWIAAVSDVADRLKSYTAHDAEAFRQPLAGAVESSEKLIAGSLPPASITPSVDLSATDAVAQRSLANQGDYPLATDSATGDASSQLGEANVASDLGSAPIVDEPAMGELAKRLIAQLGEANAAESERNDSLSMSQSLGAWVASSEVWDRVSGGNDDDSAASDSYASPWNQAVFSEDIESADSPGEASAWQAIKTPSVWNLPSEDLDSSQENFGLEEVPLESPEGPMSYSTGRLQPSDDDHLEDATHMLPRSPVFAPETRDFEMDSNDEAGTRAFDFRVDLKPDDFESASDAEEPRDFETKGEEPEYKLVPETPRTLSPVVEPDDDSIEAYMNRLLQRVQGQSGPATTDAAPKSQSPTRSEANAPSETSPVGVVNGIQESKPPQAIDPSEPFVPRSQAPEHSDGLAAMRELANATADSAISQSVRGQAQQLKSRAIMDLMQGGVVMICAFAFYTCAQKIPSLRLVWLTAAVLAFALACFFFVDMLKKLLTAKSSYDRASGRVDS